MDQFLKSYYLEMAEGFPHDPHKVLSNLRVPFNSSKYITTIDSTLASLASKESCGNHSTEKDRLQQKQIIPKRLMIVRRISTIIQIYILRKVYPTNKMEKERDKLRKCQGWMKTKIPK